MKTIHTLGEDFVKRHEWLLATTHTCGVAICGGCAAAIGKGNTDYVPQDIDLVATKESALTFLRLVTDFLLQRNSHFRIFANSHNDFVPAPAEAHFRIQCGFWVPVCLFVLPYDQFRTYRIQGPYLLQLPQDVKQAADLLTATDNKPRLANDYTEEPEPDPTKPKQELVLNPGFIAAITLKDLFSQPGVPVSPKGGSDIPF